MRAWAHTDPAIAKVVAQVDDERLTYMSNLLRQRVSRTPTSRRTVLVPW